MRQQRGLSPGPCAGAGLLLRLLMSSRAREVTCGRAGRGAVMGRARRANWRPSPRYGIFMTRH